MKFKSEAVVKILKPIARRWVLELGYTADTADRFARGYVATFVEALSAKATESDLDATHPVALSRGFENAGFSEEDRDFALSTLALNSTSFAV